MYKMENRALLRTFRLRESQFLCCQILGFLRFGSEDIHQALTVSFSVHIYPINDNRI